MFGDYLLFDSESRKNAKIILDSLDKDLLLRRSIISIGGISGSKKSETAYGLAELLISRGKTSHIISSDDYYKISWAYRNEKRKKDLSVVGPNELDWVRLNWTFETWNNSQYASLRYYVMSKFHPGLAECTLDKRDCDILIFEGLYGCDERIPSQVKVHLGDCSPESTYKFRNKRKKENETSVLRKQIVERECEAVKILSENADITITQGSRR